MAKLLLLAAAAHIAGGTDTALEQPGLVIEAVGIEVTVRPPQPHGEEPTLAGMHSAGQNRRLLLLERAAIPRQEELPRQALAARSRLHLELEAHAALADRGQARNHPNQLEITALELRR